MGRRVVLAACALLVACAPSTDAGSISQAIVGGAIDLGDPQVFQVRITGAPSGSGTCSATLIGARTLLTAAHCLDPKRFNAATLTFTATNAPDTATATDWRPVAESRIHPAYNSSTQVNDVGLLLLETAPGLTPKGWNPLSVATYGGKPIRAAGYGSTSPDGGGMNVKRDVGLTFRQLTNDEIWIGDQESKGICTGDSGGPSFHTFSDGVERVVGVHSTSSLAARCFDGVDQRVDFHAAFIRAFLMEKEAAGCWEDGRCVATGCATVDLDCVCGADGLCTDKCPNLAMDPDCPADCIDNGICAAAACPRPDVDCGNFTGACAKPKDCLANRCVTDPQHPQPYCSAGCSKAAQCDPAMECDGTGTCRYKQLPMVTTGGPCTPGKSLCEEGSMCVAHLNRPQGTCTPMCLVDSDCGDDGRCIDKFCKLPVTLPRASLEGPVAVTGCSSVPGLFGLVALIGLLRRRRR